MKDRLNFSPQPFRSRNIVLLALWATNLVLIAGVVFASWHWLGLRNKNAATHAQIDGLEEKQRELAGQNTEAVTNLENVDMKIYRKQVLQFHEIQLAFQTHWGQLLDQLSTLMPADIRLRELRPINARSTGPVRERRIHLMAEARNKAAQLTFVQTLQEDKSFEKVSFESESYKSKDVALVFEISFNYLPGRK